MYSAAPLGPSELVCNLVDRSGAMGVRVRETLGELAVRLLASRLERSHISEANTSVTADGVRRQLAGIEHLVDVGPAHAQALRNLVRGELAVALEERNVGASANGGGQPEEEVAQLRLSEVVGEAAECVELVLTDLRCSNLKDRSHEYHSLKCNR